MAVQIKTLVCPQCGSGRCRKVEGTPNLYACSACGTEFVLSDSNAPKEMRVIHSLDEAQFGSLQKLKYLWPGLIAVLALIMLAPMIWNLIDNWIPKPVAPGLLKASTVYETTSGQFNVVRVLEKNADRIDHYQLLINSLDSGKPLAEPQAFSFQRTTLSQSPQFAHFSDGSVFLIMNGQKLMRLDPGSSQFVSLDNELVNRYAAQLGVGVSKLEWANSDKPDGLLVTSNAGERYYVFWLTGEILPQGLQNQDFAQRPFNSYTDARQHYAFDELDGLNEIVNAASAPGLLIRYSQKIKPGQYQSLPSLRLQSDQEELVKIAEAATYVPVAGGWVTESAPLQKAGISQLELVPPVQKRFRGNVLAHNAQRVLIVFNTTPVTDQGRVLQLLDQASGQPVWSRTLEQLPQITRSGSYLSADALPSGFYLRSDDMTPSLLISNDGQLLHDFSPRRD